MSQLKVMVMRKGRLVALIRKIEGQLIEGASLDYVAVNQLVDNLKKRRAELKKLEADMKESIDKYWKSKSTKYYGNV